MNGRKVALITGITGQCTLGVFAELRHGGTWFLEQGMWIEKHCEQQVSYKALGGSMSPYRNGSLKPPNLCPHLKIGKRIASWKVQTMLLCAVMSEPMPEVA
ncbi:hypothetical protein llap_5346 [Limosa lapponica baueri]|uniref:Uncharacterized protein n=1 Tax=Limosa lapponica baueri TaxID=1758121 RepID=A0A2I0UE91_LIMLA|nr:hypothetical protein llap_5346 [Limosa lapponica baueri]